MSDETHPEPPPVGGELPDSAPAVPQALPVADAAVCPITADFLPPNMRKHVDPKAPVPLRMMAAKGLVPLSPADMAGALFMLSYDAEAGIREAVAKTVVGLPDRILSSALRDEGIQPPVLAFMLGHLWEKDSACEMLVLNASTPDHAVAGIAGRCSARSAEIIGQNQLRILRHEDIIRQLCLNPSASPALLDSVCDFAVRSGVSLPDVPQMKEARIRLFGPEVEAAPPPEPVETAAAMLEEFQELKEDAAAPLAETKRLSLSQRVMKMSVSEKIKLATLGNKEARGLLIRDPSKLVATAVVRSPRITIGEVRMVANNRAMHDDVLRVIYNNREWTKDYPTKLNLVKNAKVPQAITMRFLGTLRESDVRNLARDRNVPNAISTLARKMLTKK